MIEFGYIKEYHDMLAEDPTIEDDLNEALDLIFSWLQCLPISVPYTQTKPGSLWSVLRQSS